MIHHALRIECDGSAIDDFLTHLSLAQRPVSGWCEFQRDIRKIGRLLRALPSVIAESRLALAIRRLQKKLRVVRLFERDPREFYASFTARDS
ncbi:hypothetical protein EON81_22450 [bacterium]|nr:MAG: hypothetical protein EON81_22450 [bacterium]